MVVPSEMPVPEAPGLLFAETLVGVDVVRLRAVHAELLAERVGSNV